MKNCLLAVISLSWWSVFVAQEYVIQRRRDYRPDTFIIPSPQCSGDVSAQCAAMNAGIQTGCKCVCNNRDQGMLYKNTFGFYENSWKCASNTDVRGGCSILFYGDADSASPITTILSGDAYDFKKLNSSCTIASGSYASCNGKWKDLNNLSLTRFSLTEDQDWGMNIVVFQYEIKVGAAQDLKGRIVKLNITCTAQQQPSDCVVFKIQGRIKCPISFPSSSSMQPTQSISLPLTSSTPKLPSTSIHVQQTKTSSQSVPTVSATPTEPVSVPTSTIVPFSLPSTLGFPTSTQDFTPAKRSTEKRVTDQSLTTSKIIEDGKRSASRQTDSSGMIAGAVAGVIGLVIIVIAIIVVMRKRKKRDAVSTNTTMVDNAGYGRGEDHSLRFNSQQSPDENEYSYAYNNALPFMKTDKQDMEYHANNDPEPGTSVANEVYDQSENLNQVVPASFNKASECNTLEGAIYAKVDKPRKAYPSNSDGPIYNTIEEPEYAKVDKSQKTKLSAENHDQPLYNVLEGPETDEGPFSEGAPVYDVLEGPESDEAPVYGAIEGQDPHVYGTLNMTDFQGSPDHEENRGYDDMVYDSVGDVINDHGDIYQELNQSGQRNSDVYQALNYPDKTIYCLNELNQTHSNA